MHFCLTTYNQSGNKKEQHINISGLTVGQAQEKRPKKVAQNPRVQDALKKALKY